METKVIKINPEKFIDSELSEAIRILKNGGIIGFPTETVYGLGSSIYSEDGIKSIFKAKGRPQDNPLIVHISSMNMLKDLVKEIPTNIENLCKIFWPGPLTILFKKEDIISDIITADLPTVAIRMPSHPIARRLIKNLKEPIAAPSANRSGRPSPTMASHVYEDLNGLIPLIIDGGSCGYGIESTVIDIHRNPPLILRPGGLTLEELKIYIPKIEVFGKGNEDLNLEKYPSTPGLKYTHYSPIASVILIDSSMDLIESKILEAYNKLRENSDKKIGLIHTHFNVKIPAKIKSDTKCVIKSIGLIQPDGNFNADYEPSIIARHLFAALRSLDNQKVEYILVEGISEEGEGLAVMNRLKKAASKLIL